MSQSMAFDVELPVPCDVAIARVTEALKSEGFGVLTHIDVQATLKEKIGADIPPYAILGACNPPIAHRAITHDPRVGLLLPCNVVVEATATGSLVRIGDPAVLMNVGPLGGDTVLLELAGEVRGKLERVAEKLKA